MDARCEGSTRDQRRDAVREEADQGSEAEEEACEHERYGQRWKRRAPLDLDGPAVKNGRKTASFAVADNSSVIGGALLISL